MSAKVRVQVGKAWVEVDAEDLKGAAKALSPYYEVFFERHCGKCKSEDIGLSHRHVDGYDYYAIKCFACGSQLDLGQHKDGGTLFPKRKDAEGNWDNEHGGWYHWKDRKGGDEGF